MIALQIYLEPVAGKEQELEQIFEQIFTPAISIQKGFVRVSMLKSREALREYQIELVFESEELRLGWVASKEHQEAFPQITALCQRVSWSGFDITGERAGA
jgi:heme-degrading monooxygenase HmoA